MYLISFLGFGLGPLIEMTLYIKSSILPTAFFSTAIIFACFTLSSIFGDRRKTLYFGGILFSALSLLLYMSLFNLFFNSYALSKVIFLSQAKHTLIKYSLKFLTFSLGLHLFVIYCNVWICCLRYSTYH